MKLGKHLCFISITQVFLVILLKELLLKQKGRMILIFTRMFQCQMKIMDMREANFYQNQYKRIQLIDKIKLSHKLVCTFQITFKIHRIMLPQVKVIVGVFNLILIWQKMKCKLSKIIPNCKILTCRVKTHLKTNQQKIKA